MALHINILLGANTFDVNGDVPDLQHIVELFQIWVTAQGDGSGDPAKLAELTQQFKDNQLTLQADVNAATPTP